MAEETIYVDPTTGKQIPMKDGKPCRVCVDFKTWAKLEKGKKPAKTTATATSTDDSKEGSVSLDNNSGTKTKKEPASSMKADSETKFDENWKRNNCPADVQTLGRHTWTLLHTMAAYYPEKPEKQQQESMKTFFESFSEHYPCWFCKNDFKKDMAENPIDVTNRETLSEWLCRRHNKVNEKLGKKQFDCIYHIRTVCRKFQAMGEFHIYQNIKSTQQTIAIKLDGCKNKSLELVAKNYDPTNRIIEFRPKDGSSVLSLANTSSSQWSAYHRLTKIHFSGWFSNKAQKIPYEQLSPQDQAMVMYHYQYNSFIEKTYELPSWNQTLESRGDRRRYVGDKGLILSLSYQQQSKQSIENRTRVQPTLASLPTSYYSYRSVTGSAPMPTAPTMQIQWIRVTLDWVLGGLKSDIPSTQIYKDTFKSLNQMLAKEGCFKYDPLSEPVLDYIVQRQDQDSQLPASLVKYVHSHTHECHTRLSRLQRMLEGAGVDPQVLWKYTFAKSFVVGNGSLLSEEDVVRRIQDSEEEWRQKKLSLSRKLYNCTGGTNNNGILI
ncbi:hypothetical protein [Parasitella parasitica]|uniref:Sulfhydryl oxidase n=1 Tax=Parasitella parasitica TaxID=35722 RepID=A0A0B7MT66_9FUNG|nr:hypothetical protein [Parasitella parasitica]